MGSKYQDEIIEAAGFISTDKDAPSTAFTPTGDGIWGNAEAKTIILDGVPYVAFPNGGQSWTARRDTKGLFEEFRRLSSADLQTKKGRSMVLAFARKNGPFWDESTGVSIQGEYILQRMWDYLRHANSVQDTLLWAAFIKTDNKPPQELIDRTPFYNPTALSAVYESPLSEAHELPLVDSLNLHEMKKQARRLVLGIIQENISKVKFTFIWEEGENPRMEIQAGFGFLPAVWFQISQAITLIKGIYTCSLCGKPYPRTRKPVPLGRNNYCEECSPDGIIGAKRKYKRDKDAQKPAG
ncbi:MAG: hypothetical protein ACYCX4_12995 [Bacillota bacterium]